MHAPQFLPARLRAFFAAIIALFFVAATNIAHAQFTFANDVGANYGGAGEPTFANGQNGGTGFNAWSFTVNGNAGGFIGNPSSAGIGGMSTESFGLYANPTNSGNSIDANRNLTTAMGVGDTFSFQWGANFDANGPGNKGFNLYVGGTQVINVNMGGSSTINFNGNNTGFGYGTNVMAWTFTYLNPTTLSVSANDRDGVGTFSTNVTVAGGIDSFRWYASQLTSGDQRQPYYNNLLSTNSGVFSQGGTVTNNNTFSGGGNLSIGASTTLALGGNLTYTGATTISNGSTLRLQNSGAVNFASALSGGGAIVISNGSGQVNLSGTGTGFTGAITVANGSLEAQTVNALGSTNGGTTVNSGGALRLWNNSGGLAYAAEALTLNGFGTNSLGGALRNITNNNTWQGNITYGSGARINSDNGTLAISGTLTGGTNNMYFGGVGNITLSNTVSGSATTGDGSIFKDGSGTLSLNANNSSLSGLIRLREGTILITNGNSLGSGSVEVGNGANTATLLVNSDATIANRLEVADNSSAGVINVASGQTVNVTGILSQTNGTLNTTKFGKDGAGILVFNNGGGTYNGQLQIGNGSVVVGATGALGTNTSAVARGIDLGLNVGDVAQANNVSLLASNGVTVGQSIFVAANTGSALRTIGISGAGSATFSNEIYLGGDLTVDAGANATDSVTISGAVVNTGRLNKTGSGTLVLTASNTYSGNTLISAGTLQVGNGGSTGFITNNITNNGTLVFNRSDNSTAANLISGNGAVVKRGAGTTTLTGANTFNGALTIAAGGLSVGANNNLGGGTAMTISNAGKLLTTAGFSSSRAITIGAGGGEISVATGTGFTNTGGLNGSTALTKSGTGTMTLATTAGDYSGTLTISGGTVAANTTLSSADVIVANSGVLAGSGTLDQVTVQAGGRVGPGNSPGNLSLGALTFDANSGYNWEVDNVSGTAGTNWDLITVGSGTGTVTFGNTSSNKLTIYITGAATGFSNTSSYSWLIIDAGTLSGFSADAFAFNYSTLNGVSPTGAFSVSDSGGDLMLLYDAPSAVYDVTVTSGSQTQSEASGGTNQFIGALATVNKLGAGTLVMTNADNSYTGVTTVKQGTLQIDGAVGTTGNTLLGQASSAVVIGDVTNNTSAAFNFGAAVQNDRGLSVVAGTGAAGRTIGTTIGSGTATQAGTVVMATNTDYSAASGGTLQVSGAISGAGNATVTNSGTVVFSGDNTYTGTTTVSSNSTLVAANNSALGATNGGTTVNSGGTLALSNNISTAENITIAGTGVGTNGALRNLSGANTSSGTITVASAARINADASSSLSVNNINLGSANTLSFGGAGTNILTGGITNVSANTRVFKDGTGELVINNAGATTGNAQMQISGGKVTLAGGSYSTSTDTVTRALDLGLDAGDLSTSNNVSFYVNAAQTMSNSIYVAPSSGGQGTRTLGTESTSGTATFNREIYLGGNLIVSAAGGGTALFSGNIINSGNLTKSGNGTVTLSGANTFAGSVAVNAGTLNLSGGSALNDTNAVTVESGATFALGSGETIGSLAGAGDLSLGTSQLITGGNNSSTTLSGAVSGSGGIVKQGTGTMAFSGANTFTGGLFIDNGTADIAGGSFADGVIEIGGGVVGGLQPGNDAKLTISTNATISRAITVNAETNNVGVSGQRTIDFANPSATTATLSGTVSLEKQVFVSVNTNVTGALSGVISGAGSIVKQGSGTLSLSGANTFTGGLFIDAGTANLAGGSLASGVIDIGGGSQGNAVNSSDAKLLISTAGTFDRTINLNAETNSAGISGERRIEFANAASTTATLSGAANFEKTALVDVATGATGVMSGVISGAGALTKSGNGTLTLSGSGANTFTNLTTVSAGTLNLNKTGGNAIVGDVLVSSGATLLLSASDQVGSSATPIQTVTLSGGTITRASGVSETFGVLSLTAKSFINYSGGVGAAINFRDLNYTPSALLTLELVDFTQGSSLVFQNTGDLSSDVAAGYFTSSGLGGIGSYSWDSGSNTFTITAIPEPSTYLAAAGLLALFLWPVRRRLIKDAKSILGLRPNGRDRIESYRNA